MHATNSTQKTLTEREVTNPFTKQPVVLKSQAKPRGTPWP